MRLSLLPAFAFAVTACGDDPSSSDATTSTTMTTSVGESTTEAQTTESSSTTDPSTSSSGADTSTSTESSSGVVDTSGTDESSTTGLDLEPGQVAFETTLGTIIFQLDDVAAPITTANFLTYVDGGFYDGTDGNGATIFHRVVPGFVVQGGGLTEALETKATLPPIVNEFGNGLTNDRGTISMARTNDPDSATSQFFINLVDNPGLDQAPGYAVFGEVVVGMDVVDTMATVMTESMGDFDDVPVEPIIVLSVTRG